MFSLNPYSIQTPPLFPTIQKPQPFKNLPKQTQTTFNPTRINYKVSPVGRGNKFVVKSIQGEEAENKQQQQHETRRDFLTLEEAGLVEMSGLNTHERFLCRLTVSSLNLLRVISEQEGCTIEELNAGRICDWFMKDKLKREQNMGSAVLQWDDSHMQF